MSDEHIDEQRVEAAFKSVQASRASAWNLSVEEVAALAERVRLEIMLERGMRRARKRWYRAYADFLDEVVEERLAKEGGNLAANVPWVRRVTFLAIVVFVMFPLASTGSIGGSLFGRLLGLSRVRTVVAVVLGSLSGCAAMYFGAFWSSSVTKKGWEMPPFVLTTLELAPKSLDEARVFVPKVASSSPVSRQKRHILSRSHSPILVAET